MTTTIRAKAQLLQPDSDTLLAKGVAVIWGDPDEWGGIFEILEATNSLSAAVASQSLNAELDTHDGRRRSIKITSSNFNADDEYPLTFKGTGEIDTARYHAFSSANGRLGMQNE